MNPSIITFFATFASKFHEHAKGAIEIWRLSIPEFSTSSAISSPISSCCCVVVDNTIIQKPPEADNYWIFRDSFQISPISSTESLTEKINRNRFKNVEFDRLIIKKRETFNPISQTFWRSFAEFPRLDRRRSMYNLNGEKTYIIVYRYWKQTAIY